MIKAKVNIREIENHSTMRIDAKYWIKDSINMKM
jgi:hypothetical protein